MTWLADLWANLTMAQAVLIGAVLIALNLPSLEDFNITINHQKNEDSEP